MSLTCEEKPPLVPECWVFFARVSNLLEQQMEARRAALTFEIQIFSLPGTVALTLASSPRSLWGEGVPPREAGQGEKARIGVRACQVGQSKKTEPEKEHGAQGRGPEGGRSLGRGTCLFGEENGAEGRTQAGCEHEGVRGRSPSFKAFIARLHFVSRSMTV